jgi:hypothetical protein
VTTAAEITARLRIEPDHFRVKGSRIKNPDRPAAHGWQVHCDLPGLSVSDQIDAVIDRVIDKKVEIAKLVVDLKSEANPGSAVLQVVRYFNDKNGEEENGDSVTMPDGTTFEKLSGQHQLLGWHLGRRTLDFLDHVGAVIDVDEYG